MDEQKDVRSVALSGDGNAFSGGIALPEAWLDSWFSPDAHVMLEATVERLQKK